MSVTIKNVFMRLDSSCHVASTFSMTTLSITTLSITTLSLTTLSKATLYNTFQHNDIQHNNKWNVTLSIMTLNTESCFSECRLCWVTFMLSVIYAECHLCWVSFMLSAMYAECHLCQVSFKRSVANKSIMLAIIISLNVIMLSVVILNVVAPLSHFPTKSKISSCHWKLAIVWKLWSTFENLFHFKFNFKLGFVAKLLK